MPVTGAQYDPAVMAYQLRDPGRSGLPTAWLTRAGPSDGCHRGSLGRWPTTEAHATDDNSPMGKRWLNQ